MQDYYFFNKLQGVMNNVFWFTSHYFSFGTMLNRWVSLSGLLSMLFLPNCILKGVGNGSIMFIAWISF